MQYAIPQKMAIFETADQLYDYIDALFAEIATLPEVQDALNSVSLNVQFSYSDPMCEMTLAVANGGYRLTRGTCAAVAPDVVLTMTGDTAHRFWTGDLNVMGALTTREIGVTGSLGTVMRLAPIIKAAVRYNRERETTPDS